MGESALAVVLFLRFRKGKARIAFDISVINGGRSLCLVLYYRQVIGIQNGKKVWEFPCRHFPAKYWCEGRNSIIRIFRP